MARENGAQFPDSDINSLIAILQEIELNTHPKKGNIPNTPKYEDFTRNVGNLDLIVPMGFLMLHNDLEELIANNKGKLKITSEEGRNTKLDVASSIGAIAGLAGVIGGSAIVANLTKNMTLKDIADVAIDLGDWVIGSIPNIADNISYLVDTVVPSLTGILPTLASALKEAVSDVGAGLASTAMDVKDIIFDDEVNAQRKDLLKTYLNLNYAQLYETLGYEAIIDNNGDIAGIQKKSQKNYFENLSADTTVGDIAKESIKGGLNNLLNSENLGKEVGESVGGAIAGFKTARTKAYADLIQEELPQMVLSVTQSADLAKDEDLRAVAKEANRFYVKAYYAQLIAKFGYIVDYEAGTLTREANSDYLISTAKELIGDALNGGGPLKIQSVVSSIGNSISTISASLNSLDALGDEQSADIKKVYSLYVMAYYAQLIAKFGYLVDYEKGTLTRQANADYVINTAKELIGDVLSGGVGLMIESVSTSLGTSISSLSASMNSLSALGEEQSQEVKEAYTLYVKAYYANLIAGLGYSVDYETGVLTREVSFESIKNSVLDTVGDIFTSPFKTIANAITDVNTNANLQSELKDSVIHYVRDSYLSATSLDTDISNLNSFVSEFYKVLYTQILDKPDDFELNKNQRDTLKDSFAKAMGAVSTNLSEQIQNEIENKVEVSVNSAFNEATAKKLFVKMDGILAKLGNILSSTDEIKGKNTEVRVEQTQTTPIEDNSNMAQLGETRRWVK